MINNKQRDQILKIWNNYSNSDKLVLNTKGNVLPNIDGEREKAIETLQKYLNEFVNGKIDIHEFKTTVDSFNKRNNLWGFTATKGQMFFNQLVRNSENKMDRLVSLLKKVLIEPKNLEKALDHIEDLETYCFENYKDAEDRRKVANPSSVGYFLSYFWQIQNHNKWPIIYTSLTIAFEEIALWKQFENQKGAYEYFFRLNEEVKKLLRNESNKDISNWQVEHAFWKFKGNPNKEKKTVVEKNVEKETSEDSETKLSITANFKLEDYLFPKVAKLIDIGANTDNSSSKKGTQFENLVSEIFKLMDFDVQPLGQGYGRNPDAIIKFPEEHTAFLVDAKAYTNGYSLGLDDRAIKEYISYHTPILKKEGYTKLGFIIVSNSFKSNFEEFVNDITWNTEIKRFILLQSEALLYLLAYKSKDRLTLPNIIETITSLNNPITAKQIIEEYDDV